MKERRGYIVLVLISVFLSACVLVYGSVQQNINDHKFCDLFDTLVNTQPVPKPANPKTDPSRARSYDIYIKFLALDRSLGCRQ